MNSVRDYRNNPKPITFSEFKRLINSVDEKRYGDSWVYFGEDNQCPVVNFSITAERPPIASGVSGARLYVVSDGVPSAIQIHFIKARKQETIKDNFETKPMSRWWWRKRLAEVRSDSILRNLGML
jgi:hypothetical protein